MLLKVLINTCRNIAITKWLNLYEVYRHLFTGRVKKQKKAKVLIAVVIGNRCCTDVYFDRKLKRWLHLNNVIILFAYSGTYQGQWLRGMRHGYGVRTSAPFGLASKPSGGASAADVGGANGGASGKGRGSEMSLNEDAGNSQPALRRGVDREARGGFVLRSKSDEVPHRRRSLVERSGMKNFVQV